MEQLCELYFNLGNALYKLYDGQNLTNDELNLIASSSDKDKILALKVNSIERLSLKTDCSLDNFNKNIRSIELLNFGVKKSCIFEVPYPIGTYLTKIDNGQEHLDQVYKYIFDKNGISVILKLDAKTEPRLSIEISIKKLLEEWKEDTDIHLSGDIGTRLYTGLPMEDELVLIKKRVRDKK